MPIAAELLKDLRALLPPDSLIDDPRETAAYECDGLTMHRQTPPVVALPGSREETAAILKLCGKHRTPIVARGAGTGLSGGALPRKDGVLLSMAKMNRILEIDPELRQARTEPGRLIFPFPRRRGRMACFTRPTRRRKAPAPSAATLPKTPAGCIASNTG